MTPHWTQRADGRSVSWAVQDGAGVPDGFIQRAPTFLGGKESLPATRTTTNRAALAEWMTTPENRWFARAAVNRTWWRLMGRGIVKPVDDMHEANEPSHPQLLELLARKFADSGFDLKFLTRAIVLSRAYQRTSQPGEAADQQAALFGRMSIKVLSAGQLYDSLETISGPAVKVTGIDVRQADRVSQERPHAVGVARVDDRMGADDRHQDVRSPALRRDAATTSTGRKAPSSTTGVVTTRRAECCR